MARTRLYLLARVLAICAEHLDLYSLNFLLDSSNSLRDLLCQTPEMVTIYRYRFRFLESVRSEKAGDMLSIRNESSLFLREFAMRKSGLSSDKGCTVEYFLDFQDYLVSSTGIGDYLGDIVDLIIPGLLENPILFLLLVLYMKNRNGNILSEDKSSLCRQFQQFCIQEDTISLIDELWFEVSYSTWGQLAGHEGNPYQYRSRDIRHYERFLFADILKQLEVGKGNVRSCHFSERLRHHAETVQMSSLPPPQLRAYKVKDIVAELSTNAG